VVLWGRSAGGVSWQLLISSRAQRLQGRVRCTTYQLHRHLLLGSAFLPSWLLLGVSRWFCWVAVGCPVLSSWLHGVDPATTNLMASPPVGSAPCSSIHAKAWMGQVVRPRWCARCHTPPHAAGGASFQTVSSTSGPTMACCCCRCWCLRAVMAALSHPL
jgi:hypothetical protein